MSNQERLAYENAKLIVDATTPVFTGNSTADICRILLWGEFTNQGAELTDNLKTKRKINRFMRGKTDKLPKELANDFKSGLNCKISDLV